MLQRRRRMPEGVGVIHCVAHDFFYIVAGFIERDGFGVNRAFHRLVAAPLLRPPGAGIIGGRSQQWLVIGKCQDMLEIIRTQGQIGVYLGHACGGKFPDAHFFRYPFRGSRHQLHQARRTGAGSGIADETAFLTDEAIYPGLVEFLLLHEVTQRIAVRSEKTQGEIMLPYGFIRRIDCTVIDSITPRDFSGGQQAAVVEIAYCPGPFACGLRSQIQAIQGKRPFYSRQPLDGGNLL